MGLARLVEGEPDRAAYAGPCEPCGDGTVLPWLQSVEHDTAIDERTSRVDERRITQEPELWLIAGRLSRSSAARLDGRRGPRASAAMIRRRVGSASNSIPDRSVSAFARGWIRTRIGGSTRDRTGFIDRGLVARWFRLVETI